MEDIIFNELQKLLNIDQNVFFDRSDLKKDIIFIYPSKKEISSSIAVSEICCIEEKLRAYKEYFDVEFSFEQIKISLIK